MIKVIHKKVMSDDISTKLDQPLLGDHIVMLMHLEVLNIVFKLFVFCYKNIMIFGFVIKINKAVRVKDLWMIGL